MGQADWAILNGSSSSEIVRRGATSGTLAPNGGGSFVYGMRSTNDVAGAVALHCVQTGFSPMDKGGRISGALRRSALGGPTGFAPFLFFAAQGPGVDNDAYLLGLSDEDASHIELRKGSIAAGVPDGAVAPTTAPNILMRSTDTYPPDSWQHLRLDVIRQGNGDVLVQVFRNDLAAHSVASPIWALIAGMDGEHPTFPGFVDDALGVNTGASPLIGGLAGFGARFEAANRAVYLDHIAVERQI